MTKERLDEIRELIVRAERSRAATIRAVKGTALESFANKFGTQNEMLEAVRELLAEIDQVYGERI